VTITPDDIIIANGVSGTLELALSSLLDKNTTLLGEFSDNDKKWGAGRGVIMCTWEGGKTVTKLAVNAKSSVRLCRNMFANSPFVSFSHPQERNVRIADDEVVITTQRDAPIVAMTTTATKIGGEDVGKKRRRWRRKRSRGCQDVRGVVPWTNVAGGRSCEGNIRGNPAPPRVDLSS
jgi:hypothetical protein